MKKCSEVELLLARYVDGDARPEERADVDTHIDECRCCRDDLTAQRAAREVLQARRDDLCESAPPNLRARCLAASQSVVNSRSSRTPLNPATPGRQHFILKRLPLAAAATIVLAVAAVFGLGLNNKVQALAFQMTVDHMKCARFNNPSAPADHVMAGQQWASKFGWPITVPPSSEPAGLELRGVRRCGVTDGRVAHVMYQWRGEPLSLYVLPAKVIEGTSDVERFGHESVMWSQNGRTYVVLARTSRRDELGGVVHYMRSNVY
jgi:anti-sigma factor RsiW